MRVLLTFDVELWSWRGDFELDIAKPLRTLDTFAEQEGVPLTLFVSPSDKGLGENGARAYVHELERLLSGLSDNALLEFGIHSHCLDLPLSFRADHDELDRYDMTQIGEIIGWSKDFLDKSTGRGTYVHRAGGYHLPSADYDGFMRLLCVSGIEVDSSDISISYSRPRRANGVYEVPPATDEGMAMHGRVWSPDNMALDDMIRFFEQGRSHSPVLVMSSHSFLMHHAGFYGAHSLPLRAWFSLPPSVQRMVRPALKLAKRSRVNQSRRAALEPGRFAPALEDLRRMMAYLRQRGCRFCTFKECLRDWDRLWALPGR